MLEPWSPGLTSGSGVAVWLSSNIIYHSSYLFGVVGDKNW